MKKFTLILSMLLLLTGYALAQRTITGVVTDAKGAALATATVLEKGTTNGAITDMDGKYSITVPEGSTLVFSMTGFDAQEIAVGASKSISVSLAEGTVLKDVVVTALGISREAKSLGYGVTQVKGSDVAGSGEVNAVQGLAAKASGIQVIGSGGTPGASSKILIRGNSTFTGNNQPLFVVDGVPYDNQTSSTSAGDNPFNPNLQGVNNSNRALDINPDDIETISVLKGPSASALYGTRASSGVVLITTKRGAKKKNGAIAVDFSSSISVDEVNKLPAMQREYAQGTGGGAINADTTAKAAGNFSTFDNNTLTGGTPQSWGPRIGSNGDARYANAYNNYDIYFKRGITYNNNIAISMGNDNTNIRFSYGNTSQSGIVPNTNLARNTFRVNADSKIDKLSIRTSAAFTSTAGTKAQNGSNLSGVMLTLARMPASFNMLGGNGENGYDTQSGDGYRYQGNYDNPLWSVYNNPFKDEVNRLNGNIQLGYEVNKWFNVSYRLGADSYSDTRKQIFAIGSNTIPTSGEIQENALNHLEVNSDLLLNFKKDITKDFTAGLTLGNNLNHRFDKDLFTRGRTLTIPNFYNMSNATERYVSESQATKRLAGFFFDANFAFKNMLYLNVTGRQDYSSTFGAKRRESGFFYPGANLSFVFTELIPKNNILSFGKLRASYAQTGIEPSPYTTRNYYTSRGFTDGFTDGLSFPYGGQNGFGLSTTLGNQNLEPELVTAYEAGINLRFLGNRINLDVNYYNQTSSNLLVARPIPVTTGFDAQRANIGKMRNQGIEIELSADIIKAKEQGKFNWNLSGNFTRNRNEVLALAPGVDEIDLEAAFESIGSFAIVGQPYGVLYATKWLRNPNGDLIINPATGLPKVDPTRGKVGNPYPDFTAGIRNTLSWKGVTVGALLDIRKGGDIWGGTVARINRFGTSAASGDRNRTYIVEGVVATTLPTGEVTYAANKKPISANSYFSNYLGDGSASATENAIFDGSWIRLREVSLTYDVPAKLIGPAFRNLSVFATGRNLWLSTKYPGVDPETSLTGASSNVGGFDYFNMPSTKSYVLGLRVGF